MLRYFLPLGAFAALVLLLYVGLGIDPRQVPSPFIGKPAPSFQLPELYEDGKTISEKDMLGKVWVLNVFASWCVSCRAEHEVVTHVAQQDGLPFIGLNYKDEAVDAKAWLARFGNPYTHIAVDYDGMVGIDWGVYGVPESFVVDKKGIIRHKFTGPIDEQSVRDVLRPLLEKLRAEAA